jgi:endonuclease-8
MPEGDTIFRAARTLERAVAGHDVTRFESVFPHLTRLHQDHPITGRRVERVESVGKHLLMRFSGDTILRTHMRMNGSWHIYRPGERWQRPAFEMRIIVGTADFVAVAFNVPVAEFETTRTLALDSAVTQLGPDLLSPAFDAEEAIARLRARADDPINEALLDQRAMAGVGNVFKSEVLFVCRVDPFAPVSALDDATMRTIVETARTLLRANVLETSPNAIVTYHGFRNTTRRHDPTARLWVYGRARQPCRRCGTPIAISKAGHGARLTYWCPECQCLPGARPQAV